MFQVVFVLSHLDVTMLRDRDDDDSHFIAEERGPRE